MKKDIKYWLKKTAQYRKPNNAIALWQLFSTLFLTGSILFLSHFFVQKNGFGCSICIDLFASLFIFRLFLFQHDCGHDSFTTSSRANKVIGFSLSIITTIPFFSWALSHDFHHLHNAKLELNSIGDLKTLTVEEYNKRSSFSKLAYAIFRFAAVFGVGGAIYIFWNLRKKINYSNRLDSLGESKSKILLQKFKKVRKSVSITNVILIFLYSLGVYYLGIQFLIHQLIIILGFAIFAMWLFYIHHQFEDVYKAKVKDWNYFDAALKGCSYYKLPIFFDYFTVHGGIHYGHHLDPAMANYNLKKFHCSHYEELKTEIQTLTFRKSLKSIFLHLYDEKSGKMISFKKNRILNLG